MALGADVVEGDLARLAQLYGIALEYVDQAGDPQIISEETVVAVLTAMGVAAETEQDVSRSIVEREQRDWRRVLPPVYVQRQGQVGQVKVHLPQGQEPRLRILTETEQELPAVRVDTTGPTKTIDGEVICEVTFEVPSGLPTGWHELQATFDSGVAQAPIVVVPDRMPEVDRAWGPMIQLYSLRSSDSWGMGDLADLSDLAQAAGTDWGAGFVLVNPMHAPGVLAPVEPSPYLPATRRFFSPLYLRVQNIPEYEQLSAADLRRVDALFERVRKLNDSSELLDRDVIWDAKLSALEIIWSSGMSVERESEFRAFVGREGVGLQDFALWCALTEVHGPDWHEWPEALRDVRGAEVTAQFAELEDRVLFFSWLQWQLDLQFTETQSAARSAGMPIGIMHDLAVGVHSEGSDSWSLREYLVGDVAVGAPPDMYNQIGQTWSQPPWHPDALAEAAYVPYRNMLREVLRHSGGLRVDHILGLYRQWWIPEGMKPYQGTYVAMDYDAMVGILMLEASRVGAMLIGEDLGTVAEWIRHDMHDRGILGVGVLWFERADGVIPAPESWRSDELLSVTVHDLPPTAGYISGEHITVRSDLNLLTRAVADEWRDHANEMSDWRALLVERGLFRDGDSISDEIVALYALAAASPAKLLGVNLPDLTGDSRIQNQPGTEREYPNWSVPLGDATGTPVLLNDLMTYPLANRIVRTLRERR